MIAALPRTPVRRVAFLGTPDIAVGVLRSLIDDGIEVAVVVTRKDKRRGRGSALVPSPVKELAVKHGLRVVHSVEEILDVHAREPIELGIVVAFGEIVRPHVLAEIPMVNLHVSLLPRWRGAAPIERAILAGDEETGVCLMQLEEGLDTGGVISRSTMRIGEETTVDQIRHRLMVDGTQMLLTALRNGAFDIVPQQGEPTYASKLDPSERHLDWSESATMVSRRVRIGDAWTMFRGRRLKIHAVAVVDEQLEPGRIRSTGSNAIVGCGTGSVMLVEVQPEGRPRIGAQEWIRGARILPNESMSDA